MNTSQSNPPSEDPNSPQRSGSSSRSQRRIQGDYSGNIGHNNIYGSFNVINNYGGISLARGEQILQCLYTSGYESHRRRVREPVEGTCSWVTEHRRYRAWLAKKTSGLLWLSADPGCGKSVIASFLVKHLETHSNTTVCYFFFKDDSDEQRSATFALCAILHQLFRRRNSLCRYAERAFKEKGTKFTEEADTLWDILVKAVAEGGCGDVICIVDALDECAQETQAQLIRLVARLPGLQNSGIPLKFLVTSRPYHTIERRLGSHATPIRLKGEDEVKAITADVSRVIGEGIEDLESYWGQPGGLGYLRDLLESSADRTFIWVSLVLEILKDSVDDSPEGFTNIIKNSPRDLAELYTKILNKSADTDKARRILKIVVAAARPLTLQEMNVALKISRERKTVKDLRDPTSGFERTVKNMCGNFVRIIDSKIYLVHQTAREFLLKGSSLGRGNWQYSLCPGDSNYTLANICLTYLSLEEFGNDVLAGGRDRKVRRKAVDDYRQKYPFLDYAARYWADHFRDSQDQQMQLFKFTRPICEIGSRRCITWFQVYWSKSGNFGNCPEDFTHLMTATWLGQRAVVERLLQEGRNVNARCNKYGTALNVAAIRKDRDIARLLLQSNVRAYLHGTEYNILNTKRSELRDSSSSEVVYRKRREWEELSEMIMFLEEFCIQDIPDRRTLSGQGTTPWS